MSVHTPLPSLCASGTTAFERKLLLYLAMKPQHPFELRRLDSTQLSPDDLPPLEGDYTFVPMFEASMRVFLFEKKIDRQRAEARFATIDKKLRPAKVRKPRARKAKKATTKTPRSRAGRSRK